MRGKPETILQTSIVKALRQMGVWVIVMNVTKRRGKRGVNCGEPGMPDLCLPALGWGEIKLPGGELEPDQVIWHARARNGGVRVCTWTSTTEATETVSIWLSGVNDGSWRMSTPPIGYVPPTYGEFAARVKKRALAAQLRKKSGAK